MSTKPEIIEILSDSEEDEGAVPSSARGAAAVPSPAGLPPARRPGRFRAQVSQQASAGKEVISEDESGSSSFTSLTTSSGNKVENHRPKKKVTKKAIPPADDSTHAYRSSEHSKRGTLSLEDGSSASGTATSGSARNGSRTMAPTATGPSAPKKLGPDVLVHWPGISWPANLVLGVAPKICTFEGKDGKLTEEQGTLVIYKSYKTEKWVQSSKVQDMMQGYGYTRSGELSVRRSKRLKDMEAAPSSANVSNAVALDEDVEEQLVPIQDEVPTHAPNTQDDAAEALAKREATIAALVQELREVQTHHRQVEKNLHEIIQDQQSRLKRLEEMESKPPPSQTIDKSEQSMETENSVATSDCVKLPDRFARNPEQVTVVHHNANQGSKSNDFLKSVGGAVLEVGSKLLQVLLEDNSPAPSNKGWSGVNDGAKSIHYKMVDNAFTWAGVLPKAKASEEDLDLKEAKRQGEVLVEDLTRTIERLEGQSFDAKAELLFRLSFLKSVLPVVQRPHRDFAWDYSAGQGKRRGCRETKRAKKDHGASSAPDKKEKLPYLAFMPLTEEGMYLQVWVESPEEVSVENPAKAHFVFIPFGQLLLLPGKTIHGGVSFDKDEPMLRLHFYLYLNGPPDTEYKNVYVNEADLDLRQLFLSHPVTQDNVDSQAGP